MPRPRYATALLGVLAAFALAGCPAANPTLIAPVDDARNDNGSLADRPALDAAALAEATRPVGFELGPHRFVLPANWFIDGRGPDFQGNVTLALHWPSLEPYPPGQPYSSFTTGPMRNQRVVVALTYIDRVPIDELPERYVTPQADEDASNPSNNLALRVRLPDRYGLEVYRTDLEKVALYSAQEMQRPPRPPENYIGADTDWFIRRDDAGRIRTVIKCDDGRRPDGEAIDGDRLVEIPGSTKSPQCGSHLFAMAEYSISIRAGYSRPIVRDWQRIEAVVRDALRDAHIQAQRESSSHPTQRSPRP